MIPSGCSHDQLTGCGALVAGNILIDYDPSLPDAAPHLVCLDAGLAYQIHTHDTFLNIVGSLMLRKGEDAGLHMLHNAGKGGVWAQEQVQAYCGGVQDIVDAAGDKQFFEHLGTYIYDFFRLAYTHEVKLDHNFVCVAMAVKVMEGLAISLNPSLDLIKAAIPYVMSSKIAATTKGLRAAGALAFAPAPRGRICKAGRACRDVQHVFPGARPRAAGRDGR